jgi:cytochrome c-type biogenesis protein CcmH/NrfG
VAQLWEKTGNSAGALNAWQRLLELVPGDKTATDAVARLTEAAK